MANTNKIVLSGYYGFDNIGDEAVLYSIIAMLKKEIPQVQITVLSNNPEKTARLYQVESINRWDMKNVAKIIKACDLLISGGGSLLQDVTSSKTIPYYLAIVKMAQFYKKKVVFYSQGIGPVNKGFSRWLIKKVVNKVDGIFVRDPASKALLEEIGVKKPIGVAIDPVLGISLPNDVKTTEKTIGIYIRPWQNEDQNQKLISAMKEGLIEFIKKGYKLCLIPMHYEQDLDIAKAVEASLAIEMRNEGIVGEDQIKVIDKMLSIEEVLTYTAGFEFIIGMRLHSLIMAAATKVPMLGLSYDPKVDAFLKEARVPYCLDVSEVTEESFKTSLLDLEKNLTEQKKQLKISYEANLSRLYLPIECIKKLLKIN